MLKRLAAFLFSAAALATAQAPIGVCVNNVAQVISNGLIAPIPYAKIYVCPAGTTSASACQSTSNVPLYTSTSLLNTAPNPFTTDIGGNYFLCGAHGHYAMLVSGASGGYFIPDFVLTDDWANGGTINGPLYVNPLFAQNYSYNSLLSFGDSITQGTGATTFMAPGLRGQQTCWAGDGDYGAACYPSGPTAYAYLLAADFGNGGQNYGRGGDTAEDETWHVALWSHPTLTANPVVTSMIGTNDNSLCSTNANCQDTASKAETFAAAQSLIPDSLKTFASSCSAAGTWTADVSLPGAMYTTSSGASLTCSSTSSAPFTYVAYEKCDNTSSGTGSVTVNGVAGSIEPSLLFYGLGNSNIYWNNQTSIASGSGIHSHCSLALARNGGQVGANTTVITATNSGRVEVFWVGGPYVAPTAAVAPPLYVIGGVPYESGNAGQPGVSQYNAISQNVYNTLLADGNNIKFANVQTYMNSSTDFTGGGGNGPSGAPWAASWLPPLHPGDGGMYHIYQAFRDQLQAPPKQSQVLCLWAGASGSICSTPSLNGRYGADQGTAGGQTSSVLQLTQTGNEAVVGINFQTPGSDLVTFGQWGTGQGDGLPGVTALVDTTQNFLIWNTDSDGDFCTGTALAGTPNANQCAGATLFSQGGNTGNVPSYRVGIDTQNPGVFNSIAAAAYNSAQLQIDGSTTSFAELILQTNNASTEPIIHLVNLQNASGQRDWLIANLGNTLEIGLGNDAETSSTPALSFNNATLAATFSSTVNATGYQVNGSSLSTGNLGDWNNASIANGDIPVWNSTTQQWTATANGTPRASGTNGYYRITQDGTIEEWVLTGTLDNNTPTTVTLPHSIPSTVLAVTCSDYSSRVQSGNVQPVGANFSGLSAPFSSMYVNTPASGVVATCLVVGY